MTTIIIIIGIIFIVLAFLYIVGDREMKREKEKEREGNITDGDKAWLDGFSKRVNECLEDGLIDQQEEQELAELIEESSLKGSPALLKSEAYTLLVQSLVLRDLQEGCERRRVVVDKLPILLGKNERLLWAFENVEGYEEKTYRQYHHNSSGLSFKVYKGVYYRVGTGGGYSTEHKHLDSLGNGTLFITNKNITFIGDEQVKICIKKIFSTIPHRDGVTLVKDGARPKPYTFTGFDPWFITNAISILYE